MAAKGPCRRQNVWPPVIGLTKGHMIKASQSSVSLWKSSEFGAGERSRTWSASKFWRQMAEATREIVQRWEHLTEHLPHHLRNFYPRPWLVNLGGLAHFRPITKLLMNDARSGHKERKHQSAKALVFTIFASFCLYLSVLWPLVALIQMVSESVLQGLAPGGSNPTMNLSFAGKRMTNFSLNFSKWQVNFQNGHEIVFVTEFPGLFALFLVWNIAVSYLYLSAVKVKRTWVVWHYSNGSYCI